MFKINLRLLLKEQKRDKAGTYPVILYQTSPKTGKELVKFTGIRVVKKHWDKRRSQVNISNLDHAFLNKRLEYIVSEYKSAYIEMQHEYPDLEELHVRVLANRGIGKRIHTNLAVPVSGIKLTHAIKEYQNTFRGDKSDSHINGYKAILTHLEKSNPNVTLEGFDKIAWQSYKSYLVGRKMQNSTIGSHFYLITIVMKYFILKGHKIPISFMTTSNKIGNKSKKFSLTRQEVGKLVKYKPEDKFETIVRDLFLFSVGTGCRIGEVFRITGDMVDLEMGHIDLNDQNKSISNPRILYLNSLILPIVKSRVEKRGGSLLFPESEFGRTQYNKYIKLVAEKAGIDRYVGKIKNIGNEKLVERMKVSDLISPHIARHTFTTMILEKTQNAAATQDIVGHRNISTTLGYAHVDNKNKDIVSEVFNF